MEKIKEVGAIVPPFPFNLLFRQKKRKYRFSYGGEKYLIVKGRGEVLIDKTPAKMIKSLNIISIYRIPAMQMGKQYTIELYSPEFFIAKDKDELQGYYDRLMFSEMVRTVVIYGLVVALLVWFIPMIVNNLRSITEKTAEALKGFKPQLSLGQELATVKPAWEIRGEWIIERRIPNLNYNDVKEWRKQIRYDRDGNKHYFVFVQLKSGEWKLYEIWHPTSEYKEYERFIKTQTLRG